MRWFTTLLAREFDMPDCLRLWDSLFSSIYQTKSLNFLIITCSTIVCSQKNVLLNGDFAKVITTLQQPYTHMNVNQLIQASISRSHILNDPNYIKNKNKLSSSSSNSSSSSSSFRRERVEKVMKNVAGVVNEKAFNLYGRMKLWASDKNKKGGTSGGSGGSSGGGGGGGGGGGSSGGGGGGGSGGGDGGGDGGSEKVVKRVKSSTNKTPSISIAMKKTKELPKTARKKEESFVEEKSLFVEDENNGSVGLFDDESSDDEGSGIFGHGTKTKGVLGGGGFFD
jgi:hypothetical protein